jgi:hypothetical protein
MGRAIGITGHHQADSFLLQFFLQFIFLGHNGRLVSAVRQDTGADTGKTILINDHYLFFFSVHNRNTLKQYACLYLYYLYFNSLFVRDMN